ncbi:MAG: DNA adenine methylase [Candidatus Obscuribacterales bacterium]|nr:DNA adenine methylase [Candidatus Obscuribacterales bacterium]
MNTAVNAYKPALGITSLPAGKTIARPFLKWAGGKSQLLASYEQYFPKAFNSYFEPFIGGGAVFFHLQPGKATISDLNPELTNCYQVIRDDVESVIRALHKHTNNYDHYYKVRDLNPDKLTAAQRAARMIFLNRTCFNGLYRVNSSGKFNVPFGKYKNPRICDADNLRATSKLLKQVNVICAPFETALKTAKKGDFIYLDPPYQPVSTTAYFTSYTKGSFREEDQERLAEVFTKLSKRGCLLMLSNSDNDFIRDLYSDFRQETVLANRAINCKGNRRGPVKELLVLNY